jgi:cytidine deaminase
MNKTVHATTNLGKSTNTHTMCAERRAIAAAKLHLQKRKEEGDGVDHFEGDGRPVHRTTAR